MREITKSVINFSDNTLLVGVVGKLLGICFLPCFLLNLASVDAAPQEQPLIITHGPIIGRPDSESMGVWARTNRPGLFRVHYREDGERGERMESDLVTTILEKACAGYVILNDLKPNTGW